MFAEPVVAVLARQAGTAHAFVPLAAALRRRGVPLRLLSAPPATAIFAAAGLLAAEPAQLESLTAGPRPAFLLTGTGTDAVSEDRRIWAWGRDAGVPSLAFVDGWVNYWQRFSLDEQRRFDRIPHRIGVVDDLALARMAEYGCPSRGLTVVGNPAFDELLDLRERLTGARPARMLFVSQPLSRSAGVARLYPYDEYAVLRLVHDALALEAEERAQALELAVRPHPADDRQALEAVLRSLPPTRNVRVEIDLGPRLDSLAGARGVVGMTSMLLYEAALLGRPVLSVQPHVVEPDDLTRHPGIEVVTNPAGLQAALARLWTGGTRALPQLAPAVPRFTSLILSALGDPAAWCLTEVSKECP